MARLQCLNVDVDNNRAAHNQARQTPHQLVVSKHCGQQRKSTQVEVRLGAQRQTHDLEHTKHTRERNWPNSLSTKPGYFWRTRDLGSVKRILEENGGAPLG
jgi:hypothetical protein